MSAQSTPLSYTKIISFVVPCYNSAEYLDKCVESLLPAGEGAEIILVNDGSTKDNTSELIHAWEERYPETIVAIDQENKGHGGAVNTGLEVSRGLYFKVVDSDDWLDEKSLIKVMDYLRSQQGQPNPTDMVIANYVYEKVCEGKRTAINYRNIFPERQVFSWGECGHFTQGQYILMHSIIYRTSLLKYCNLRLPEHCFYVDNIFVYVPLPYVKTMYYLDADLYRYFIGREDQSVNESVMMERIDQQILITRFMIDSVELPNPTISHRLERYMENYLSMMMCICTLFLRMKDDAASEDKLDDLWQYLQNEKPALYHVIRNRVLNRASTLPTKLGKQIGIGGYKLAQKIFNFN